MANESGTIDYAKEDCMYRTGNDTYNDYVTQKVSYLSKDIISIVTTSNWYAGGVSNVSTYGYTFDEIFLNIGVKEQDRAGCNDRHSHLNRFTRELLTF